MLASKWAIIAALGAMLSFPSVAAMADEQTPSPLATPSIASPKPSESSTNESDSSNDQSDDKIGIEGSPIDTLLDTDKTRENLESIYDDPADVALAPKLLVPLLGSSKTNVSKFGSTSSFNIYQLQHGGKTQQPGAAFNQKNATGSELQIIQSKTATLNSVPVNIDSAQISFKTPAEEFFDGTYKGLLILGSSAVAMVGFILFRGKRRDHS